MSLFVLIDSRIKPQKIDLEFITFLGEKQIPFSIIFTKSDKVKNKTLENNLREFEESLLEDWDELPNRILSSSVTKVGQDEILEYIQKYI